MKNILLLTDFSKNAQNAIAYALHFFTGGTCHFFILHVHKVSGYTTGNLMSSEAYASVYDSIVKNPKQALTSLVEELRKEFINEAYSYDTVCDYDTFLGAVQQTIRMKEIDLIVMGTNGVTSAKEVIFGSNTLNVIRNISSPVFIIPENYIYVKPTTFLFAIEHNEILEEKSLKPLIEMIFLHRTKLDILMLEKDKISVALNRGKRNEIATFFKEIQFNFHTIINVRVDIAIDCFVQLRQVSIIAKIIHKKSFFNRLFSGSTIDEITYNSKIPLLIIHP